MTFSIGKKIVWIAGLSATSILLSGVIVAQISPIALAGFPGDWPVMSGEQPCDEISVVQHVDKIIFHPDGANFRGVDEFGNNVTAKPGTLMDIKVADWPEVPTILVDKVADALNVMGWTTKAGNPIKPGFIVIDDVEYSTYCTILPVTPHS